MGNQKKIGEGAPGPGRPRGMKNKKTVMLERVFVRCAEKDFHPADVLIEIAMDVEAPKNFRIQACSELLGYIEGKQKDARPIVPQTPEDSVEAAKEMQDLYLKLSKPLEPAPNAPA